MNTLPFPPIVLTHITEDTARAFSACPNGIAVFKQRFKIKSVTAISVNKYLKLLNKTNDWKRSWLRMIAGLQNLENENGLIGQYGNLLGHGNGDGYGDGYEYGDGYGTFQETSNGFGTEHAQQSFQYQYGQGFYDGWYPN